MGDKKQDKIEIYIKKDESAKWYQYKFWTYIYHNQRLARQQASFTNEGARKKARTYIKFLFSRYYILEDYLITWYEEGR